MLRKERLTEAEHSEDIHAIGFLEFIIRDVLEFFVSLLEGSIVHKDVDGTECVEGFPRHRLGYEPLANIAGQENGFATGFIAPVNF